jgi:hypothetical protein
MFSVVSLSQLDSNDCEETITRPVQDSNCPVHFTQQSVEIISGLSGGYPYFIQFICREVYDIWVQQTSDGAQLSVVPQEEITRKLDTDANANGEFSVQDIVDESEVVLAKGFGNSHVNQILATSPTRGWSIKTVMENTRLRFR